MARKQDNRLIHRPLAGLGDLPQEPRALRAATAARGKPASARPAPSDREHPPATPAVPAGLADDRAVFVEAMADVMPLDERGRVDGDRVSPRSRVRWPGHPNPADGARAELEAVVSGTAVFDISATEEHIEGIAEGVDRRLLRQLRRGAFAIQGHIDLHGATSAEAKQLVESFIERSRQKGHRCLLIVHGRGNHSKGGVPVLKQRLQSWLLHGRLSRLLLAFCSARPADGGVGAVYVLLRR